MHIRIHTHTHMMSDFLDTNTRKISYICVHKYGKFKEKLQSDAHKTYKRTHTNLDAHNVTATKDKLRSDSLSHP